MSRDNWAIFSPEDKLYAARGALEWLLNDLSPDEVATLLRDYVQRNYNFVGGIYSSSVIHDMLVNKLSMHRHNLHVAEEAQRLTNILVNSVWWKTNLLADDDEKLLDKNLDLLIADPENFTEGEGYAF